MYLKIYDKQGGADLSSKNLDIDRLISILQKAQKGEIGKHKINVMCDDWHRTGGVNPGGSHSNHHGIIEFIFPENRDKKEVGVGIKTFAVRVCECILEAKRVSHFYEGCLSCAISSQKDSGVSTKKFFAERGLGALLPHSCEASYEKFRDNTLLSLVGFYMFRGPVYITLELKSAGLWEEFKEDLIRIADCLEVTIQNSITHG